MVPMIVFVAVALVVIATLRVNLRRGWQPDVSAEPLPFAREARLSRALGELASAEPPHAELAPAQQSRAIVPAIDHAILQSLFASGARAAANVPKPAKLARGSLPPMETAADLENASSDLDDAETLPKCDDLDVTLRQGSDLDDDAETRMNMRPVR